MMKTENRSAHFRAEMGIEMGLNMSTTYALEMHHITKRFPALIAVNNVDLQIAAGTVHAICGENGAGKSTLMKILAGEYPDYEGEIQIHGKNAQISTPMQAKQLGIEIIHQELGLARPITVSENILAGRLPRKRWIFLDSKAIQEQTRKYLDMVGLKHISPNALVSSLSQHEAQLVEIAKALSNEPSILIMDEPTSSLSRNEVVRLFEIIRKLKEKGLAILYISHFLNEVFEVSDEITTMRDGSKISTQPTSRLTQQQIIHEMVGRDVRDFYAEHTAHTGEVVLNVEALTRYGFFKDVSFEVHEGEIFGICGLAGAGRSELARALVGIDKWDAGTVTFCGKPLKNKGYAYAIRQNLAYLTEDRKTQGLALDQSVGYNVDSARSISQDKGFWLRSGASEKATEELMTKLKIIPHDAGKTVRQMSGGNQQKVLLAKWLNTNPKLLILDEPTRGVDVGAKEMIHETVKEYVNRGNASIVISSDLMELIGLSDRILILNHGRVHQIIDKAGCTEESLLMASNGGTETDA